MQRLKAIIFDKDDTLMQDQVYSPVFDEKYFFDDIIFSCKELKSLGYNLFILSNQSGISKKKFDEKILLKNYIELNSRLAKNHGFSFDGFIYCPHNPENNCVCRKPLYGLYTKLDAYFQVDRSQSFYIGDRLSDIYFAFNSKIFPVIIHRNNYFYKSKEVYKDFEEIEILEEEGKVLIFNTIEDFVKLLGYKNNILNN